MLKIYEYKQCSTCRNAIKFLKDHKVPFQQISIVDQPPSYEELETMYHKFLDGNLKKLFNTSGQEYRRLNLKDRLDGLSLEEAIELLASHGKLIKRPFAISENQGTVGFDKETWQRLFT